MARLAQDSLSKQQSDVFWNGPVSGRLSGVQKYLAVIFNRLEPEQRTEWEDVWIGSLAEKWIGTLCRMLISIQRYRHGGALLLTPSTANLDIKYRINYSLPRALINLGVANIAARHARLQIVERLDTHDDSIPSILYLDESVSDSQSEDLEDEITGCIRFISSLSCVDGLILATPDLAIKGFGVEIRTRKEVDAVYLSPRPHARPQTLRKSDPNHYGTRHRSMMRYCAANSRAIGFVISQDGEIRAVAKVGNRLVMWENLQVHHLWNAYFKRLTATKRKPSKVVSPA